MATTTTRLERPAYKYEGIVILHPDTPENEQKALFQKNKKIIQDFGGQITVLETWGKRKLANSIDKLRMGVYFHYLFEGKSGVIAELERTMNISERALRFMHTRLDDRRSLSQHMDEYREVLNASRERDQEREAKIQAKKLSRERRPVRGQ